MVFGVLWPGRSPWLTVSADAAPDLPLSAWLDCLFVPSLDPHLVPIPGMRTDWKQPETDEGTQKAEGRHHIWQKQSLATVYNSPGA